MSIENEEKIEYFMLEAQNTIEPTPMSTRILPKKRKIEDISDSYEKLKEENEKLKEENEKLKEKNKKLQEENDDMWYDATRYPCCEHIDEREETLTAPSIHGSDAAYCQEWDCTCMEPCTYETVYGECDTSGMRYLCHVCRPEHSEVVRGNKYKILCHECVEERDIERRIKAGEIVASDEEEEDEATCDEEEQ